VFDAFGGAFKLDLIHTGTNNISSKGYIGCITEVLTVREDYFC
jgi:hypothetical protein